MNVVRREGHVRSHPFRCTNMRCYPRQHDGQPYHGCGKDIVRHRLTQAWEVWELLDLVYVGFTLPDEPPSWEEYVGVEDGDEPPSKWATTSNALNNRARRVPANVNEGRASLAHYLTCVGGRRVMVTFADQPMQRGSGGRPASYDTTTFVPMSPEAAFRFLHGEVLVVGRTVKVTASGGWRGKVDSLPRHKSGGGVQVFTAGGPDAIKLTEETLHQVAGKLVADGWTAKVNGGDEPELVHDYPDYDEVDRRLREAKVPTRSARPDPNVPVMFPVTRRSAPTHSPSPLDAPC